METFVILLVWMAIAALIACFIVKKKKVRICIVIIFAVAATATFFALDWYFTPMPLKLPENSALVISSYKNLPDYSIEDEEKVIAITELLETLEIQRELGRHTSNFPEGQAFQTGDFFIIEVHNLDEIEYEIPLFVGDYTFVISTPDSSRYRYFDHGNLKRYKILGAESIIDELIELIKYSKSSMG